MHMSIAFAVIFVIVLLALWLLDERARYEGDTAPTEWPVIILIALACGLVAAGLAGLIGSVIGLWGLLS